MCQTVVRLHRDERGSLSIVSVFTMVLLVFLLGMVVNSARQVDHKVKLQNAADASAHAGGIVLTRGMNTLAFTNHLLADVFALTAFMREARDRTAEAQTPQILDNWERVAPAFIGSEFPPFDRLGYAIQEKVPRERELVLTYSDWAAAGSELMLPVLETILAEQLIPKFQRALVVAAPILAQVATDEMARRHGAAWPRTTEVHAALWRTLPDPVGGSFETQRRTLPVVDPVLDLVPPGSTYFEDAVEQRRDLAHEYLDDWNDESMEVFDRYGKFSQFSNLWRTFTCGHLDHLLNVEYPDSNLPFQIRTRRDEIFDETQHLEADFTFVAVTYRRQLSDRLPRIFRNPVGTDAQAYAQVRIYVPRRRLVLARGDSNERASPRGGIPGESIPLPSDRPVPQPSAEEEPFWVTVRQSHPWHASNWNLVTQNWSLQLVPATSPSLPTILSRQPAILSLPEFDLPALDSLEPAHLTWISHH